jgi:hypothetical protein
MRNDAVPRRSTLALGLTEQMKWQRHITDPQFQPTQQNVFSFVA